MSGGSYDYAYGRVNDFATRLRELTASMPAGEAKRLRRAFADHLVLVAEAMHDIEWVDSGDYGCGDEVEPLKKVLGRERALEAIVADAKRMESRLEAALKALRGAGL